MTGRAYWADPQHTGYLVCRPQHADTVPDHCGALVDDVIAHEHWHLNVEARYDALRTVVSHRSVEVYP